MMQESEGTYPAMRGTVRNILAVGEERMDLVGGDEGLWHDVVEFGSSCKVT
jgi:hypothetical protein